MNTTIKAKDVDRANNAYQEAYRAEKVAERVYDVARAAVRDAYELGRDSDEFESARAAFKDAETAWIDAMNARASADDYARALTTALRTQAAYLIDAAIYEHADDLAGLPARYKRTKAAIKEYAAQALGVSPEDISAYDTHLGNVSVSVSVASGVTARTEVYGDMFSGNLECAESIRNWARHHGDPNELTPAKVRRLAAARSRDLAKLKEQADAYRDKVRATIGRYLFIDETDELRDAARVTF